MALRRSSTSRPNSTLIASNSKSMRACPGSMLPPVTLAPYSRHTSADSTWRAVWVRISRWRRSQSTTARTAVPTAGGSPAATRWRTAPSSRTVSVTTAVPPAHSSRPVSPGCPPPRG